MKKRLNCWYLIVYKWNKFRSQLSWAPEKFYNLGPWSFLKVPKISDKCKLNMHMASWIAHHMSYGRRHMSYDMEKQQVFYVQQIQGSPCH